MFNVLILFIFVKTYVYGRTQMFNPESRAIIRNATLLHIRSLTWMSSFSGTRTTVKNLRVLQDHNIHKERQCLPTFMEKE